MNERSRAAASASVPVLLAVCFGVGCSEGGTERSPGDVPTFHGTVDLEFGEVEGEDPICSPGSSRSSRTRAGG